MRIEPFAIEVPDLVLDELRERIHRTRWPDPAPGEPWSQGADLDYLRGLLAYWADGFDWRAQERWLNRFEHRVAEVDGGRIHFVHHRATGGATPLVLTHGWPSTFVEPLSLVQRLGDRFDLVVPSLPGYGFSPRPAHVGVDRRYVARLWHQLMQGLGYERYGAHGGDFGAGVATCMALLQPDRMIGIHLSTAEMWPYTGPGSAPLSAAERAYVDQVARWDETERGYSAVQSTRPQTLGYALNDSPAGLAAWVLDKWRSWSDCGGDLDARFGRDSLLTMLTIWWASGSITPSMRDYYDNRWHSMPLGARDVVTVPTAMAVFANEFVPEGEPPRSWYERLYTIRRWTSFPRGGHFAAAEEPDLLARDITGFFDDIASDEIASDEGASDDGASVGAVDDLAGPAAAVFPDRRDVVLSTARLLVRRFQSGDADALAQYRSDPEVARFQSFTAPLSAADAVALVRAFEVGDPSGPGWFQYAIVSRAEDRLIGDVGVHRHANGQQAEIGFTLARPWWGQGLAFEAVDRVLASLFVDAGLHRVTAECDLRNTASARLLDRLGFQREGLRRSHTWIKGEWTDDLVFGILADEWWERRDREPPADANRPSR